MYMLELSWTYTPMIHPMCIGTCITKPIFKHLILHKIQVIKYGRLDWPPKYIIVVIHIFFMLLDMAYMI